MAIGHRRTSSHITNGGLAVAVQQRGIHSKRTSLHADVRRHILHGGSHSAASSRMSSCSSALPLPASTGSVDRTASNAASSTTVQASGPVKRITSATNITAPASSHQLHSVTAPSPPLAPLCMPSSTSSTASAVPSSDTRPSVDADQPANANVGDAVEVGPCTAAAAATQPGGGAAIANGMALNTEVRAQQRRERERTREQSTVLVTSASHHHHQRSTSVTHSQSISSQQTIVEVSTDASITVQQHQQVIPHHQRVPASVHRQASSTSIVHSAGPIAPKERRISPKMNSKGQLQKHVNGQPATSTANVLSRHASNRAAAVIQRRPSFAASGNAIVDKPSIMPNAMAGSTSASPTQRSPLGTPALESMEEMMARIPSPPDAETERKREQDSEQVTALVKQYYSLLEKCQSWQRYASSVETKAERLEIENRFLRETHRKQEEDVRSLEAQLRAVKESALFLEEERRRLEVWRDTYGNPNRFDLRTAASHTTLRRPFEAGPLAPPFPSPPHAGAIGIDGRTCGGQHHVHGATEADLPIDLSMFPMPMTNQHVGHHHPTSPLEDGRGCQVQRGTAKHDCCDHVQQIAQLDSRTAIDAPLTINGALYQGSSGVTRLSSAPTARLQAPHVSTAMVESHSFPPSDNVNSSALTTQILAAANRELETATQMNAVPSSVSMPTLRPSTSAEGWKSKSPPEHTLRHQRSAGIHNLATKGGKRPTPTGVKRNELHDEYKEPMQPEAGLHGLGVQGAQQLPMSDQKRLSTVAECRSDSALSEAEALNAAEPTQPVVAVDQRRQLRKISQSQQHQLHLLQARVNVERAGSTGPMRGALPQLQSRPLPGQPNKRLSCSSTPAEEIHSQFDRDDGKENVAPQQAPLRSAPLLADGAQLTLQAGGLAGLRPSSRLGSATSSRLRPRLRSSSQSFHDAIPQNKDDVFSAANSNGNLTQPPSQRGGSHRVAIRRTESAPLGQIDLNGMRSGAMSAMDLRTNEPMAGDHQDQETASVPRGRVHTLHQRTNSQPLLSSVPASDHLADQSNHSSTGSISGVTAPLDADATSPPAGQADDQKGAHRRLYMRLRHELSAEEIVRFERYVHRYDALQIQLDGPKGIVNRVRRLLLSDTVIANKVQQRQRYQFRKELAREFERIVRQDAVPGDVHESQEGEYELVGEQSELAEAADGSLHQLQPPVGALSP